MLMKSVLSLASSMPLLARARVSNRYKLGEGGGPGWRWTKPDLVVQYPPSGCGNCTGMISKPPLNTYTLQVNV